MIRSKISRAIVLLSIASSTVLISCGDRETDRHSEMNGGHESGTAPGISDTGHPNPAAMSNGMGQPVANGHQNTTPDTLSNHDSTRTGKPF